MGKHSPCLMNTLQLDDTIAPGVCVSKWVGKRVSIYTIVLACFFLEYIEFMLVHRCKQVEHKISHLFRIHLNAAVPQPLLLDRVTDLERVKV